MKGYHIQKTPIEERAVAIAEYIVKNKATVRQRGRPVWREQEYGT